MKYITDKTQEVLSRNKINTNIMSVKYIILAVTTDSRIDESWYFLDKQST